MKRKQANDSIKQMLEELFEGQGFSPAFMWVDPYPELPWTDPAKDSAAAFAVERPRMDDSPRDPADLRRFYELAREIWRIKPWKHLRETQAVAIELGGGKTRILSVMGASGQYRALAFYPDYATFAALRRLSKTNDIFHIMSAGTSFWQWQLVFLSKDSISKVELDEFRAAGVQFPKGVYPSALAWTPGFQSALPGGRELKALVEALEACVGLFAHPRAFGGGIPAIGIFEVGAKIAAWTVSPKTGKRLFGRVACDVEFRFPLNLSLSLAEKFRKLPIVSRFHWALAEIPVPSPNAGMLLKPMNRFLFVRDEKRGGKPDATEFIQDPTRPFQFADALESLAQFAVDCGVMPGTLSARGGVMGLLGRRLAELRGGGVRFDSDYHSAILGKTLDTFATLLDDSGSPASD